MGTLKNVWADKRKRIAIIAAVCVVVLVVAGSGGWYAWTRHELNVAQEACVQAVKTVKAEKAKYAKLVAGDIKTASTITVEQVKDEKTVKTLANKVKETEPKTVTCPTGNTNGLRTTTNTLNTQADWYKTQKASLIKAVKQVNSSKLDKTIDTATALLNDSNGKVQDNATLDELAKAIGAKDAKAIAEATMKVNDSIAAKTKADEEAAAKAKAEEEAAASTQTQTYSTSTYTGYSGYSGGTSSNSGSSSNSNTQSDTHYETGGTIKSQWEVLEEFGLTEGCYGNYITGDITCQTLK